MKTAAKVQHVLDKALSGEELSWADAEVLLAVDYNSEEMYSLMSCANLLSRRMFNEKGEIYAQIGINSNPCSKNCSFCSLAKKHGLLGEGYELTEVEVLQKVKDFVDSGANEIFIMTTADYDFERFLSIGRSVKKSLPKDMKMVANIGDFGPEQAAALLEAGFTGAYHVCRLREGKDTQIDPETRKATLTAIRDSKLELYYCVEPIGPEHTKKELIAEMFRAKEYGVSVMAVMRRIPVPGTPLAKLGQITELELSKIAAVTRLVAGDTIRAMGVHEPSILSLIAGANQIYAETGSNPRDTREDTSKGRGFSVADAKRMLWEAGYRT